MNLTLVKLISSLPNDIKLNIKSYLPIPVHPTAVLIKSASSFPLGITDEECYRCMLLQAYAKNRCILIWCEEDYFVLRIQKSKNEQFLISNETTITDGKHFGDGYYYITLQYD
jgi:hypothetical protein